MLYLGTSMMYFLLTLLVIGSSVRRYVNNVNGTDSTTCGRPQSPCYTIEHAVYRGTSHVARQTDVLMIELTHYPYFINNTIFFEKSISIIGVGDDRVEIMSNVKSAYGKWYIFTHKRERGTSFSMTIENMNITALERITVFGFGRKACFPNLAFTARNVAVSEADRFVHIRGSTFDCRNLHAKCHVTLSKVMTKNIREVLYLLPFRAGMWQYASYRVPMDLTLDLVNSYFDMGGNKWASARGTWGLEYMGRGKFTMNASNNTILNGYEAFAISGVYKDFEMNVRMIGNSFVNCTKAVNVASHEGERGQMNLIMAENTFQNIKNNAFVYGLNSPCQYCKLNISVSDSTVARSSESAIFIHMGTDTVSAKVKVKIDSMRFDNCVSTDYGGAFRINAASKNQHVETFITNSSFNNNSAGVNGGAISLRAHPGNQIKTSITGCTFRKNVGGSLDVNNVEVSVHQSEFHDNIGRQGGTFFVRGEKPTHITNSTFQNHGIKKVIDSTTETIIADTHFTYTHNDQTTSTYNALQYSGTNLNPGRSNFSIICPYNYDMRKSLIYGRDVGQVAFTVAPTVDKRKIIYLEVGCIPCAKGTYSVRQSSYTLKQGYEQVETIQCLQCPSGGECKQASLVSLPQFWGYEKNGSIVFLPCPAGYCSNEAASYNTCTNNRKGRLCGQCKPKTALNLLSSKCIDESHCDEKWLIVAVCIFIALGIILVLILLFAEEIQVMVENLIANSCVQRILKPANDKDEYGSNKGRGYENQHFDEKVIDDDPTFQPTILNKPEVENSNEEGEASIFTKVRIVIVFYQLQGFFKVSISKTSTLSDYFQNIMSTVFKLSLDNDDSDASTTDVCHNADFKILHKKLLTLLVWLCPLFICIFLYVLTYCFKTGSMRRRLHICFTRLSTLCYIPVATALFHMVHCVEIHENGASLNVLFSQADIVCYQWWQKCVWAVIGIWILPSCIVLLTGVKFIKKNNPDLFILLLLFPPALLIIAFKLKETKPAAKDATHNSSNQMKAKVSDTNVDEKPDNSISESNNQKGDAQNKQTKAIESMLEIILGPCRLYYWPSMIQLRSVLLTVIFVFCGHIPSRLYLLGLILIIYVVILSYRKPYVDWVVNWLDASTSTLMMMLAALSLLDTNKIYHIPVTSDSQRLHDTAQIIRFIILILPPIILVICLIADARRKKRKKYEKDGSALIKMVEPVAMEMMQ